MSELEENMSAVVLWIRCTFVVLCIYAGAVLISTCQMLRQWLSLKPLQPLQPLKPLKPLKPSATVDTDDVASAQAAVQGKLPGSA